MQQESNHSGQSQQVQTTQQTNQMTSSAGKRVQAKPNQTRITFYSKLKPALFWNNPPTWVTAIHTTTCSTAPFVAITITIKFAKSPTTNFRPWGINGLQHYIRTIPWLEQRSQFYTKTDNKSINISCTSNNITFPPLLLLLSGVSIISQGLRSVS